MFLDVRFQRLNAHGAIIVKTQARVRQQTNRIQHVKHDDWLEHVQLKIAGGAAHIHGHIVADYLRTDHGHRLALGWIDLARHDRRARLVIRNVQLAQTTARTARQPAHIVGDFHQIASDRFQNAAGFHHRAVGSERFEFVGRGNKRQTGKLGDFFCRPLSKLGMRIQSGANRRPAQRQSVETRQDALHAFNVVTQLRNITRKFLTQCQRSRVHQMRAANFDDFLKGGALFLQSVAQFLERR